MPTVPRLNLTQALRSRSSSASHSSRSESSRSGAARPASASTEHSTPGRSSRESDSGRGMEGLRRPAAAGARRSLLSAFDAAAEPVSPLLPWDVSPPHSGRGPEAAVDGPAQEAPVLLPWDASPAQTQRSNGSGVYEYVLSQHDVALQEVCARYPRLVRAMERETAHLLARTEAPEPGTEGHLTPLWRQKVIDLDSNFVDRLLPLAVARALAYKETVAEGALQVFDAFDEHPREFELGCRVVDLYQKIEALSHVGGTAQLHRVLAHGLQTRDWRAPDARFEGYVEDVKRCGTELLALLAELPAATTNALVRAAMSRFETE